MATAYTIAERESFIKRHEQGESLLKISQESGVSYKTLKTLKKQYIAQGEKGLVPRYTNCGRKRSYESERSYRLVKLYKHFHQQWGMTYILMKIKEKYPDLPMCVSRIYERRLKVDNLVKTPKNPPLQSVYYAEKARSPHDTWQIDAKENIKTLDGQQACYLTTTDEKSGGALSATVFPLWSNQPSAFRRYSSISFGDVSSMGITEIH
jgi:hypothetical protein